jgi:hypothetical protein
VRSVANLLSVAEKVTRLNARLVEMHVSVAAVYL